MSVDRTRVWEAEPIIPTKKRLKPDPRALSHEELIKLIQRAFLLSEPEGQRVVVFTGGQKGSGCSSILVGVGQILAAQTDRGVCLVDANVENPALHLCFGVENLNGLTSALAEDRPLSNYLQRLRGGNLWLLPCGSNISRLHATLTAEKFQLRLAELRREFAYVLVDAPPVDGRADAVILGRLADGVVLVLEANVTRREVARIAKETFEAAQVRLLGAVLNKRTFPVPAWIYNRL
jgi:Mrp family chromosome partitioning ATPase